MIFLKKEDKWPTHWPLAPHGGREEKDEPFKYVFMRGMWECADKTGNQPTHVILGPEPARQLGIDIHTNYLNFKSVINAPDEYMGVQILFSPHVGMEFLWS